VTQTRPRLDDDLAAGVKTYANEWRISFSTAVRILLRQGLQAAEWPQPCTGNEESHPGGQEQDARSTT